MAAGNVFNFTWQKDLTQLSTLQNMFFYSIHQCLKNKWLVRSHQAPTPLEQYRQPAQPSNEYLSADPLSNLLVDRFNRKIEYLRISVTDRCDLRCQYCLPDDSHDFEIRSDWLNFEQIIAVVNELKSLGLKSVRITGGEPLMRADLPILINKIKQLGIEDIALTTNGTQLHKWAGALKEAGLSRLNISLDSLNPLTFAQITKRDQLAQVLQGIMTAKTFFEVIKINAVYLPEYHNHQEIKDLIDFCAQHAFILRWIEVMPLGANAWQLKKASLQSLKSQLIDDYQLIADDTQHYGPARNYRSLDHRIKLGFITPLSEHFCHTCNRLRLSVDGKLFYCLGQNDYIDLKPHLSPTSCASLKTVLQKSIALKPERHEFLEKPIQIVRTMAKTGG